MAKSLPRRMPTGFYRFPAGEPVCQVLENAVLAWLWPSRPVLNQIAASDRHVLDQRQRAALIKMPSRVLLVKGVLRRHAVDRHNHLEAALGRTLAGARNRALRRGAGDDHRADALVLERLFEVGVVPFVGAAPVLDQMLAGARREA